MSTHTPGPWFTNGTVFDGPWAIWTSRSGGKFIVSATYPFPESSQRADQEVPGEQRVANMRLIAAAPDLLAALKALLAHANAYSDEMRERGYGSMELGESADSASLAGMARAAIAKAEGR